MELFTAMLFISATFSLIGNFICGAGLNRYYDSFFPVVKKYINSLGECYHAEYKQYYKGEKTDQVFSLKELNL